MIVAGFGFRNGADADALAAALRATGGRPDALATAADKAAAPAILALAERLALALRAVALQDLDQPGAARSPHAPARYHGRSLAEAAALAAAGPGARLIARRVPSPCGLATCALAERTDP